MISYFLIVTPSLSAEAKAFPSSFTVNPKIKAFDAAASITSASEISPTPTWIIFVVISLDSTWAIAWATASAEPWVFALIIKFNWGISSSPTDSRLIWAGSIASNLLSRSFSFLSATIAFISFSFLTTSKWSPACGTSDKPNTSTGVEGSAFWILSPLSDNKALTLPQAVPTTIQFPALNVPFWTRSVATGPLPLSKFASITTPEASALGLAFKSWTSATSKMYSNNSSIPVPWRAETFTVIVSPPHSSGTKPCSVNCCNTLSGFAPGLSTLLTATMIGISAAFAWLIASIVWGIIPSSAATTKIAISVAFAPLALISVKASWPGVSKNTIFFSFLSPR